jgi:hypothetical protein
MLNWRIAPSLRLVATVLVALVAIWTPVLSSAIVNGDTVTREEQQARGLVSIGTACSGC